MPKPRKIKGLWRVAWAERLTYRSHSREETGHVDYHKSKVYHTEKGAMDQVAYLKRYATNSWSRVVADTITLFKAEVSDWEEVKV